MNDLLWISLLSVFGFLLIGISMFFKLRAIGFAGGALLIVVGALLAADGVTYISGNVQDYNVTNVLTWASGNLTYVQATGTTTDTPVYTTWKDYTSGGLGVLCMVVGFYVITLAFASPRIEMREGGEE